MPSYFRQVPDFEYVSRDSEQRQISEYATVKNLFRRGKLREDIFGDLAFFTKYKIIGDERPDNVAYKIYNDETLDWVVLLSNNILNIQTEWPLPQKVFDNVMLEKYDTYDNLYNGIHHYETQEIKDSVGNLILPSGIKIPNEWKSGNGFVNAFKTEGVSFISYNNTRKTYTIVPLNIIESIELGSKVIISGSSENAVNSTFTISNVENSFGNLISFEIESTIAPETDEIEITGNETLEFISKISLSNSNNYYYEYYDGNLGNEVTLPASSILTPITNYEYESQLEDDKRNIFVLKPRYLNIVFNDLEEIMKYKKGSSQYVSRTLKKGDNIRLYN
jgi:hypothetical protein